MVLGSLDEAEDEPAFSQVGLQQFRERLIAAEMDRRLLDRTVEVERQRPPRRDSSRKTPKLLRVGVRHGRKSKSKRFNGYKQHVSTDIDTELILACTVTPANRPEEEATSNLREDMANLELYPDALFIDRAYINSKLAEDVAANGGLIVCKPWRGTGAKPELFGKRDFKVNIRDGTITCPAGK